MLKYILTAVLLVPDVASAGNFLDRLGISPGPPSKETVQKLAPYQDKAHPSFLQSAIFFMTGHEPPDQVIFVARPDGVVSAAVNRLMLERDRAAYEAVWEFKVRPDDPCTIMAYRVQPPYEIERLEFSKVPSPHPAYGQGPLAHLCSRDGFPAGDLVQVEGLHEFRGEDRRGEGHDHV